ncbi:endonuclease G [Roseateles sp. YR242]|uniref:DNA/RNA non-specific endonuclease n=1 Tax=Roseateles sp. YR242 TaxID=1855305 RepID=UPI0008C6DF22|nr:DNA/RNA non-specific endonuclease [Roseateles sp. YR242]SEK25854.1 endonuclease G [Roseateles sp. YR242]
MTRKFFFLVVFSFISICANATTVTLAKGGFTLTYDCDNRAATRYEYVLTADTGSAARPSTFYLDPDLPSGCNGQLSTASYASVATGWDRGHLVTSNHMDYSTTYIKRANYMTNIVPQVSSFNQGIWVQAENVAECYRDLATVYVYGGLVYNDASNDFFLSSHGIRTPDYFWKTIITTDTTTGATKAISWYIPNSANLGTLDSYIVSISQLESLVGASNVGITATSTVKAMKPSTTWATPSGCDLS